MHALNYHESWPINQNNYLRSSYSLQFTRFQIGVHIATIAIDISYSPVAH